jgi:AraC-type transcriptional regulator N-terminus
MTIARYLETRNNGATIVPGLSVVRVTSPIPPTSYLFEPSLCVSARGSKRVTLVDASYVYDEDHFLLTAVGLPTIVDVPSASAQVPYTSLQLNLDLDVARQIIADVDLHGLDTMPAESQQGLSHQCCSTQPHDSSVFSISRRISRFSTASSIAKFCIAC